MTKTWLVSIERGLWAGAMLLIASACASSRTAPATEPGEDDDDGVQLPSAEPSPFEGESAIAVVESTCAEGSSREIALTEDMENGFSAEDILAFVEGQHETVIRWTPPEDITVGPESGEHALFVSVTRAGSRARDFTPTKESIGHGSRCENWLEIDVTVTVQSEGGALNDVIEGTLYTSDARVAYFSARGDGFGGTLTVEQEDGGGDRLSRFDLDIVFSEHGAGGTLHAVWRVGPDFAYERPEPIASFGAATCRTGEAAIGLDDVMVLSPDVEGTSAQRALDQLEQLEPLQLTWQDGARTTATLRFTPDEPGACVMVSSTAPDDFASIVLRGELSFESEDGRVDGSWPAEAQQRGSLQAILVSLDPRRRTGDGPLTPPELGFPGLESDPGTVLSVTLNVTASRDGTTGSLELGGYHCGSGNLDSVCEYTPVQLASAVIGE